MVLLGQRWAEVYMKAHPEQVEKLIGLFVQHVIAQFPATPAERLR